MWKAVLGSLIFLSTGIGMQTEKSASAISEVSPNPLLTIETFPEYMSGFPMIVAVTITNATAKSTFYNLTGCDLWNPVSAVSITLSDDSGGKKEFPSASSDAGEGPPEGFTLRPGESRRMLYDISELNPSLEPGTYRLVASYRLRVGSMEAPPVQFKVASAPSMDSVIALQLRNCNDIREPSWIDFILYNWRTVYVGGPPSEREEKFDHVNAYQLSPRAKQALAFHFFIHRAVYGPDKVRDLDTGPIGSFGIGPLEGEAALARLEILHERGDRSQKSLQEGILRKWPGLKWRVDQIQQGEGFLTTARRSFGTEREFETKPAFFPYTIK